MAACTGIEWQQCTGDATTLSKCTLRSGGDLAICAIRTTGSTVFVAEGYAAEWWLCVRVWTVASFRSSFTRLLSLRSPLGIAPVCAHCTPCVTAALFERDALGKVVYAKRWPK